MPGISSLLDIQMDLPYLQKWNLFLNKDIQIYLIDNQVFQLLVVLLQTDNICSLEAIETSCRKSVST